MAMINGHSRWAGVIGNPISHTASPLMHNTAYAHLGLNAVYIPLLVEESRLQDALNGVKALHGLGLNVTIPYKEKVIPFLDELDEEAERIGAVNTIVNREGRLVGFNTDGRGFLLALAEEKQIDVHGKAVVILGAGGASKGIIYACLEAKASSITILSRRPEPANAIKDHLNTLFEAPITVNSLEKNPDSLSALEKADIIINTTPVGMAPDITQSPITYFDWVKPQHLCCDIIYKPAQTLFLNHCKDKGATTWSGAGMLAGQGAIAFELMTGHPIPYTVMRGCLVN